MIIIQALFKTCWWPIAGTPQSTNTNKKEEYTWLLRNQYKQRKSIIKYFSRTPDNIRQKNSIGHWRALDTPSFPRSTTNPTWFFPPNTKCTNICTLNSRHFAYRISHATYICALTISTLLVEHIISSIWINRMTTRSRWKFRICTTTNDLTLYSFPLYTFLCPEDGPQWPKHVVSLIKQIQRQLCFDVTTPS